MADNNNNLNENTSENTEKKMEICYTCGKEFDMNAEEAEGAHYHYDEYPMCAYCSNFYGFYQKTSKDVL